MARPVRSNDVVPWWAYIVLFVMWPVGDLALAGATLTDRRDVTGYQRLTLENELIRCVLAPEAGGSVCSFVAKPDGAEVVVDKGFGLFFDHFSLQTWPGELMNAPYDCRVVEAGLGRCAVVLSRTSTGNWQGFRQELQGLLIEKTLELRSGESALRARVALTNTTDSGRTPAYWSQHIFAAAGDIKANLYYRPSARGVKPTSYDAATATQTEPDVVADPTAGWTATVDVKRKRGLVFLLDYSYLRWLYNSQPSYTTEWFCDTVIVPPHKTWATGITAIPARGLTGVVHASEDLLANATLSGRTLTLEVQGALHPVRNVTVGVKLEDAAGGDLEVLEPVEFGEVGLEATAKTASLSREPQRPCVLRLTFTGEGFEERCAQVFQDTSPAARFLVQNADLALPRPPKRKRYLTPENLTKSKHATPRVLLIEGLSHRLYGVEAAARSLGWEVREAKMAAGGWAGSLLNYFPTDYDELMSFDVIVLLDADAECMGDEGRQMIQEFVQHGGGLLVFGGPYAYGPGKYAGTQLEELLPITLDRPFTFVQRLRGATLEPVGDEGWLTSLNWKGQPRVFFQHSVAVRRGDRILLRAGRLPFLATGARGRGRVAACTGTLLGSPPAGATPFWEWSDWHRLVSRLLLWLLAKA